jgi:N-formylglutamate amidohydrolase
MIIHLPHSSRIIPEAYRSQFVLSEEGLEREMDAMTDSFTGELFEFDSEDNAVNRVIFPVSRLLVDPERFADDAPEPMSRQGMGVLYSKTSTGDRLRRDLTAAEREVLLERYYYPHQRRVSDAIGREVENNGASLVVDGHSFPDRALPCHDYGAEPSPDFCLRTDPFHTPADLVETVSRKIKELGYIVKQNDPLACTFVPSDYYRKNKNVFALMTPALYGRINSCKSGRLFAYSATRSRDIKSSKSMDRVTAA